MMAFRLVNGQDPPDADYVLDALLRHNYLPMQKKRREELPPIFSSETFTPDVAASLNEQESRPGGYDAVEYRLTRFNGISRPLSLPHPLAYAQLCLCMRRNWESLQYIIGDEASRVLPRRHNDGRLIIMDYEMGIDKNSRSRRMSFGKEYMACTDIANFFPSVYTHAVPWALVGLAYAKSHRGRSEWFNVIDEKLRQCKRGETQSIAVGPATSNVISELILCRVDEAMRASGYHDFERFVDDYTAYCATEDEAKAFIRGLSEELARYKLVLNAKKTDICVLPRTFAPMWTTRLSNLPPKDTVLNRYIAIQYLNMAMSMAGDEPDESVLKFAIKALLTHTLSLDAQRDVLPYVMGLCFHQPALLPLVGRLLVQMPGNPLSIYGNQLNALACDNAQCRRSDGICWSLYYMNACNIPIATATAETVVASRDCLGLLLLYLSGESHNQEMVRSFIGSIGRDSYDLDQYWLLLYQLFRDGQIANQYPDDNVFEVLKEHGVTFIDEAVTIDSAFKPTPFSSEEEAS
jgi:hypothetical protein